MRTRLMSLSAAADPVVLVIPYAGRVGQVEQHGRRNAEHFKTAGARNVEVLDLSDPEEAVRAIERAEVIWMPGGSQRRLMNALDEAGVADAVRARFAAGVPVGGTSAGAAIMSETMLAGSSTDGETGTPVPNISHGLGFWTDVIVDQHFSERNRLPRLKETLRLHPDHIGVGIDEATAVVFDGKAFKVIGDATVTVLRLLSSGDEEPVFEKTILSAGESYSFD